LDARMDVRIQVRIQVRMADERGIVIQGQVQARSQTTIQTRSRSSSKARYKIVKLVKESNARREDASQD
jgi:hypothetical protein